MKLGCCPAAFFLFPKMASEFGSKVDTLAGRILETPTSIRIIFPGNKLPKPKEFLRRFGDYGTILQELSRRTDKLKGLKLSNGNNVDHELKEQRKIQLGLQVILIAVDALKSLEDTKEVILAPWPEAKMTVVRTNISFAQLRDPGIQFFLEIFLQGEEASIRQKALETLKNRKKVILSSGF